MLNVLILFLSIFVSSEAICQKGLCIGKLSEVSLVTNFEECQANCANDQSCKWQTFHKDQKTCHLFKTCKKKVLENQNFYSSRKGEDCIDVRHSCKL